MTKNENGSDRGDDSDDSFQETSMAVP
jgi:hypothetical protein